MKDSYFSALYKYAPVGVVILGVNMQIVNINSFLVSMFDLPLSDYKGESLCSVLRCASLFHTGQKCGDTSDCSGCRLWQSFLQALENGQPVRTASIRHTFMNGSIPVVKALRFSASAVESTQGVRVVASIADITREKQYEQLLTRELDLETSDAINRQNLIGIVAEIMQKAGPENTVSVGMAAVEGLNDTDALSGLTGSDVLSRFAEIARQCTRRQDIIGHLGNGLFLFMFSGAGIRMAEIIARRIHDTMDAVFCSQGIRGISFSAGFMELKPGQLSRLNSSDILSSIDGCLETAQRKGGMFVSPKFSSLLKRPAF